MIEFQTPEPPAQKPNWPLRAGLGFLALASLLVIFHRPLLIATLRVAAIELAARENVQLSLEIEGSVPSNITLKNLRAVPTGNTPVEFISIDHLQVSYSLANFYRNGWRDFISGYHLRNATLILSTTKGTEDQKKALANILHDTLQQPALFSDRVRIENFSFTLKTRDGPFIVGGVNARLDPLEPGFIRVAELSVPKVGTWRDLKSDASYLDRHLVLHDFALGQELVVKRLELDASRRAKGISYLSLDAKLLGGDVGLFLWRRELRKGVTDGKLTVSLRDLPLANARAFLRWTPDISGTVTKAWFRLEGNPEVPAGWKGEADIQVENGAVNSVPIQHAAANLTVASGTAHLTRAEFSTAGNRCIIQAQRALPNSFDQLLTADLTGTVQLEMPELQKLGPFTAGKLLGEGDFHIKKKLFALVFNGSANVEHLPKGISETKNASAADRGQGMSAAAVAAAPLPKRDDAAPRAVPPQAFRKGLLSDAIESTRFALQQGSAQILLSLPLQPRTPEMAWFEGLSVQTTLKIEALRVGAQAIDSGTATAFIKDGMLEVDAAELKRGPNSLQFSGKYDLPTFRKKQTFSWADTTGSLRFILDAPKLDALNTAPASPASLKGSVTATGDFRRGDGETSGTATLEARDIAWQQFAARRLSVEIPVKNNTARLEKFLLDLNGKDQLTGHGSAQLQPPYAYEAAIEGSVQEIAVFQPLISQPLGGSLTVNWHGTGQWQLLQHTGEGQLSLQHGRVGDFTGIQADIAGKYSPESIDLSVFNIRSDQGAVQADVQLHDQRLKVDQLRLLIGKTGVVTGRFSLPLDLRTLTRPETLLPESGTLEGKITLDQIDLTKLFPALAAAAPTPPPSVPGVPRAKPAAAAPSPLAFIPRGLVSGSLTAAGTVAAPELTLVAQGRQLQLPAAEKLPPASADATLSYRENKLALKGTLNITGINPLQVTGNLPLDLRRLLLERQLDPATPFSLSVKLPPSPASLLGVIFPEIRYVEGRATLDAAASGPLSKPVLAGGLIFDLPAIRFRNTDLSGISNFRGDLRFSGNELTFRRFEGNVSGGPFSVTGRIKLEPWTDPQLDLRFKTDAFLLVRNDTLTLRADSDLKIAGPLNSAQVTGAVGLTKSRYFREVEILPIGLPGRPAPQSSEGVGSFSITSAPFRNWKLDVSVKTKEPFLFRTNLANGQAYADLHLGGTGLAPTLEGPARFEHFVASLPFSRLDVDYGNLYFTADDPFNPTLDIHGSSRMRDYHISIYIYGTSNEPQTLFTSEPALPQEDIMALLATGATSKQVTESSEVLAGRAGFLLLQDLYHKAFKRNGLASNPTSGQTLDRFHLDVGTVDPRTGRQEIGSRFKLSDQYEIGAGVDVQGDVRLQLRYLMRF